MNRVEVEWVDTDGVMAMAYDYPILGFHNNTVNTLRLWSSKSTREFDLAYFNSGDYAAAVQNKSLTESISKVLYPNDEHHEGKVLPFTQQRLEQLRQRCRGVRREIDHQLTRPQSK